MHPTDLLAFEFATLAFTFPTTFKTWSQSLQSECRGLWKKGITFHMEAWFCVCLSQTGPLWLSGLLFILLMQALKKKSYLCYLFQKDLTFLNFVFLTASEAICEMTANTVSAWLISLVSPRSFYSTSPETSMVCFAHLSVHNSFFFHVGIRDRAGSESSKSDATLSPNSARPISVELPCTVHMAQQNS